MIKPLTLWVLRESLEQCAAWRQAGLNLCVAINLSAQGLMDMENNKSYSVIVHATIELGHNLGLEVVGEGVENAEVLGILGRLNCDSVQGSHLLRPMAAPAFDSWMHTAKEKGEIRVEGGNICLTPSS